MARLTNAHQRRSAFTKTKRRSFRNPPRKLDADGESTAPDRVDPSGGGNAGALAEDEFIVEAIKEHKVVKNGSLRFLVKWKGWDKESDMTWEPERHLKKCILLGQYLGRIGGRDKIFEEPENVSRGNKRSPVRSGASPPTKRKRQDYVPAATGGHWAPPAGSWEDEISSIAGCEDEGGGRLAVYVVWKNGRKTKHDKSVIYKKCPQKMLQFYEQHAIIIQNAGVDRQSQSEC